MERPERHVPNSIATIQCRLTFGLVTDSAVKLLDL
jgi:hypothetical protein